MWGTQWMLNIHEFSFLLFVRPRMVREADIPVSKGVRIYFGPNIFFPYGILIVGRLELVEKEVCI